MNANHATGNGLQDVRINVKLKLSALWTSLMFLYIYVDHFALFEPGILESMLTGYMGPFPASQGALLGAMILMTVPALMIFLSLALKARANRRANLIAGILYILVVLGNVIGETWAFYLFGSAVEVVLLVIIVRSAWTWPRTEALS